MRVTEGVRECEIERTKCEWVISHHFMWSISSFIENKAMNLYKSISRLQLNETYDLSETFYFHFFSIFNWKKLMKRFKRIKPILFSVCNGTCSDQNEIDCLSPFPMQWLYHDFLHLFPHRIVAVVVACILNLLRNWRQSMQPMYPKPVQPIRRTNDACSRKYGSTMWTKWPWWECIARNVSTIGIHAMSYAFAGKSIRNGRKIN